MSEDISEPSLVEQFQAIEAEIDAKEPAPAEPKKPAAKAEPKPAAVAAPKDGEPAKEGAEDDDGKEREGKALPAERAQFRAEKRAWKAKAAEERAAVEKERADLAAERARLADHAPEKLRALRDVGDYDAIAKAVGVPSFNELVTEAAKAFASPEYKRIKALEAREKEREQRDAEERQKREEQTAQERRAAMRTQGVSVLQKELAAWDSPDVAALASEDPDFPAIIYDLVSSKVGPHDSPTDEEVREEMAEAIEKVLGNARQRFERWQKIFGDQSTATTEAARAVTPNRAGSKQPASASKHVSKAKATEASQPPDLSDDRAWMAYAKQEMAKAAAEDTSLRR